MSGCHIWLAGGNLVQWEGFAEIPEPWMNGSNWKQDRFKSSMSTSFMLLYICFQSLIG